MVLMMMMRMMMMRMRMIVVTNVAPHPTDPQYSCSPPCIQGSPWHSIGNTQPFSPPSSRSGLLSQGLSSCTACRPASPVLPDLKLLVRAQFAISSSPPSPNPCRRSPDQQCPLQLCQNCPRSPAGLYRCPQQCHEGGQLGEPPGRRLRPARGCVQLLWDG